jgi:3-phytase
MRVVSRSTVLASAAIVFAAMTSAGCSSSQTRTDTSDRLIGVQPVAETRPTVSHEDAADDPAVWVHPTHPTQSLVLGTDKRAGLGVYSLAGEEIAFHTVGSINNIDTAEYAGMHIAAGTAVDDNAIYVWRIDPKTRRLQRFDGGGIPSTLPSVYGFAFAELDGTTYALTTSKAGMLEIIRLDLSVGHFTGTHIATIPVGGQLEGVVADDDNRVMYVGEEAVGVWRYDLPADLSGAIDWEEARHHRRLIDTCRDTQGFGNLTSDAEGITLWAPKASGRDGYLIVSSQGSDRYCVYERAAPNAYLGAFQIVRGNGAIDGTTHTDGIAACAADLGPRFPNGVFIAQDDDNRPERQNFKIVDWRDIARTLALQHAD